MARQGIRLGVDVGTVRIGVARSDAAGLMAIPLETVKRDRRGNDVRRIAELAKEREAIEIVVGLPRHLAGGKGQSAADAIKFAERIQRRLPELRVCLVDERLTSTQAHGKLSEAGVDGRRQRDIVDQVAAQIILEQALEIERLTGELPGETLEDSAYEREGRA